MSEHADEPDLDELLERAARYEEAGLLGRAALQLTFRTLDAREREVLRRHSIGPEGRIARTPYARSSSPSRSGACSPG